MNVVIKSKLLGNMLLVTLLSLAALAVYPLGLAGAQTTNSQLTITSEDTSGNSITGYYTTLSQSGSPIGSSFTPDTFTLENGVSYTLLVENFGSCNFDHWLDSGSIIDSRSVTIAGDTEFTAIYKCSTSTGSSVTVNSLDQNGNAIAGFYVNVNTVDSVQMGYTPHTFATTPGISYSIQAENYGSCAFNKWSDGVVSDPRAFIASSGPSTFTAIYYCGTQPVRTTSTINVGTESPPTSGGVAYTFLEGYYITLWQNGVQLQSCFSTCAFTVNDGETYQVIAASYGNYTFDHWRIMTSTGFETAVGVLSITTPSPGANIFLSAEYVPS